jgi:hypothetical protein
MPVSTTLTVWNSFSAGNTIYSASLNAMFTNFRGHNIAIDGSTTALANGAYDLGANGYRWRSLYANDINHSVALTTGSMTIGQYTTYCLFNLSATATATLMSTAPSGKMVSIKKIDANAPLIIDGNGKTIDGQSTIVLDDRYDKVTLIYDGSATWSMF